MNSLRISTASPEPFHPSAFIVLVKNVFTLSKALREAQDIDVHLQPLHAQLSHLEKQAFPLFETFLPALIHTVFLLWTNCKSYQRPARIVVLLQEMGNLLIEHVRFLINIMYVSASVDGGILNS